MSAATQPRVSSEAAGRSRGEQKGECGLVSEGLCRFQGQVVKARGAWKEEEELGLALPGAGSLH